MHRAALQGGQKITTVNTYNPKTICERDAVFDFFLSYMDIDTTTDHLSHHQPAVLTAQREREKEVGKLQKTTANVIE